MKAKIENVLMEMSSDLSPKQLKRLQAVLLKSFAENETKSDSLDNLAYLTMFLDAKRIEGCSLRTIKYYQATAEHMLSTIKSPVRKITTEDLREYLAGYQKIK